MVDCWIATDEEEEIETEELVIQSPQDYQYWLTRLNFLMENKPDWVWEMFTTGKREILQQHLDEMTGRAMRESYLLGQHAEIPPDARAELVNQLLCPADEINLDATPMPYEHKEKLWDWMELLPDHQITVTIPLEMKPESLKAQS